jgi:hypothetical protein
MDAKKAKTAKTKAKARSSQKKASANQAEQQQANAQMIALAQSQGAGINPEIQAQQIALQTPTTNPYHMMGAMAPTSYRYGNMVDGYTGVDPQFHPMG